MPASVLHLKEDPILANGEAAVLQTWTVLGSQRRQKEVSLVVAVRQDRVAIIETAILLTSSQTSTSSG